MTKALFFDIDGTLVSFQTHEIPEKVEKALYQLKENGYKLFIASGRPPMHIPLLPKTIQSFPWDGMVLLNGQYVLDANKELIMKKPIPKKAFEKLVPYLNEHPEIICSFFGLEESFGNQVDPAHEAYLKSIHQEDKMMPVKDVAHTLEIDIYQVCPRIAPECDAEFVANAPGTKSARWTDDFADIIPEDGGKPEGMKVLLEKYQLSQEDCMAFGDGGNDITMLEFAHIGVAMGNAKDEVKSHADYVTDDVDEDGLLKAFQHFELL